MTYFLFALFLALVLYELPKLIRQRNHKQLIAYAILSTITLIYIIGFTVDAEVFSFIKTLSEFFDRTLGLNYQALQKHT